MNEIRYNAEKLFFISIYDIYLQRFYIEKYRGRVIGIKRCIDAIVSCAPLVFLTLVMLCDAKRHLWLACASIASVIEAFSRFLPYYDRQVELEKCATELDIILGQMNYCWRKYKLDLIKVEEFQGIYERYYDYYNINLSNNESETYKEVPRYKSYAQEKAAYMLNNITSCNIYDLLKEIHDDGR